MRFLVDASLPRSAAPLGISQSRFATHVGVPFQRINEIVNGKRGITPETAWLFSDALGTTAEFWMGLQASHNLTKHRARGT